MQFKELYDRAKSLLASRKPMSDARKKVKRAAGSVSKKGPAGEQRNYKVDRKSPIGKLQERNKRTKSILDQLD